MMKGVLGPGNMAPVQRVLELPQDQRVVGGYRGGQGSWRRLLAYWAS